MLDPWIIEEILRREEDMRREQERERVVPAEPPRYREHIPPNNGGEGTNRGVIVIDI